MTIFFGKWEAYGWKNELSVQSQRVVQHFDEVISDDFSGDYSPIDMMDRAIIISAIAIRRLIEKRLVTDKLAREKVAITSFGRKGDPHSRPFIGMTGGKARDYDFTEPKSISLTIQDVANEILHSSQLMVVHAESIADGLLIASDWKQKERLLHLRIDEFSMLVRNVLDDFVRTEIDQRADDGSVTAIRE